MLRFIVQQLNFKISKLAYFMYLNCGLKQMRQGLGFESPVQA